VLDDIYDALSDDEAMAGLPAALAGGVRARSCVIQLFSPDNRLVDHQFSYFTPSLFEYYAQNAMYKLDPWRSIGARRGAFGTAVNSEDILDIEEFRRSIFFNEVFRAFGDDTARCLGGCFPIDDHILTIGLHRAAGENSFEADQLGWLQNVSGHLRRLFAARLALGRANARADQLAAALDAPLIGILRVDQRGRLVHANAAGQDILHLRDGLALVGQVVAVQAPATQQRFAEAVRTAALRWGEQGDALLVPRPSGKPPWRVIVAPDRAYASGWATIMIEASDGDDPDRRLHLCALYGLTPAEGEVAVLLAEGLSPADIADRRAVSLDTVRNQIKALLQKTGAPRLGGLIAVLARTVRTQ
jgi:DNA-binding CsgD family transcriptional regulator